MKKVLKNILKDKKILILGGICFLTGVIYLPSLANHFTPWDDNSHVYSNPLVRSLEPKNLRNIFQSSIYHSYIPLTLLTYAIEYHFFGYDPFIYHFDNLLLHCGVTALVFAFALRLGVSLFSAAIAAILFGIHPMHVESVAWVTERKDVLYGFFYLLSLSGYCSYLTSQRKRDYYLSLFWGMLAILSKAMALSLPLILLVCDWFYGRKLTDRKVWKEKIGYFLYVVPIAGITYFQNVRIPGQGILESGLVWVWTFMFYLRKFVFPQILLPYYVLPKPVGLINWQYGISLSLFIGLVILLIAFRRQRLFLFSVLFYFFSIFFLLRFDDKMDTTVVSDRFMYLPSIGFCVLFGLFCERMLYWVRSKSRFLFWGYLLILVLLFGAFSIKTDQQIRIWGNGIVLWEENIQRYPRAFFPYFFRAYAFVEQGDYEKALADYDRALTLYPSYGPGYNDRGVTYFRQQKYQQAIADFTKAIQLAPEKTQSYINRGDVYRETGRISEARDDYQKAIEINPRSPVGLSRMAEISKGEGNPQGAVKNYTLAIAQDPRNWSAYWERGNIYAARGLDDLAIADYSKVIEIQPRFIEARVSRGNSYLSIGDLEKAIADYSQVIRTAPQIPEVYSNRGLAYIRKQDFDSALSDYSAAIRINPGFAAALENRSMIYAQKREFKLALDDCNAAIKLNPQKVENYYNRGLIHVQLRQYPTALSDFEKVLSLNKDFLPAQEQINLLKKQTKLLSLPDQDYFSFPNSK
jgi:protein O-mannosyl-transferase